MTERQQKLIDFLLNQYEKDNKQYIPKELIYFGVRNNNGDYMYPNKPTKRFGDCYRKEITKDCDTINRMNEQECSIMIISNKEGYKIATRNELIEWAEKQKRFIEKKCIKRNNMLRKFKLDGQININLVEIKPFMD